jgi:DNA-binding transcriptional ArsR family regulator
MTTKCSLANQEAFSNSELDLLQQEKLAKQAKALAHPARVRILKILVTLDKLGGCLNSDLVSELGLAQSTVSEHLRILRNAEFIIAEPNPPKVCYKINKQTLGEFSQLFGSILN